jgi:hypothetical protein
MPNGIAVALTVAAGLAAIRPIEAAWAALAPIALAECALVSRLERAVYFVVSVCSITSSSFVVVVTILVLGGEVARALGLSLELALQLALVDFLLPVGGVVLLEVLVSLILLLDQLD